MVSVTGLSMIRGSVFELELSLLSGGRGCQFDRATRHQHSDVYGQVSSVVSLADLKLLGLVSLGQFFDSAKMKETRLTLLADERFSVLLPALGERLAIVGRSITADNFASMLDETMRRAIHVAFRDAHADEGTIWLVEEATDTLVAAYNTGLNAEKLVGHFKQPLDAGLISMVYANEQPFLENDVSRNSKQDKSLDSLLSLQTCAMIVSPFYFLEACRGVISCVQLTAAGAGYSGRGFDEEDKSAVCHAAATLGRLIDHRILRSIVGLS
jgi:hypothetical protein